MEIDAEDDRWPSPPARLSFHPSPSSPTHDAPPSPASLPPPSPPASPDVVRRSLLSRLPPATARPSSPVGRHTLLSPLPSLADRHAPLLSHRQPRTTACLPVAGRCCSSGIPAPDSTVMREEVERLAGERHMLAEPALASTTTTASPPPTPPLGSVSGGLDKAWREERGER